MTLYFAEGSKTTAFDKAYLSDALNDVFGRLGKRNRVIAIPPDFTRLHSRAGELTCIANEYFKEHLVDILPALGTHAPMSENQLSIMYPEIPKAKFREHRWREDVVTVGKVPETYVNQVTEGIWNKAWPAQMNKLVWNGRHDLIISIGQVVPHEVIGMANYNKNIFVGTGGADGINESHFIGAAFGMERMMGKANTPLRKILNYAESAFCQDLPILYILTVIDQTDAGDLVTRGLFIGDNVECFESASKLSAEVNITKLPRRLDKVVVYLDPNEFHSTWLGNKAIYRTRMAMADGGELIILAPGIKKFGEDNEIDRLIRTYGYRNTKEIMQWVKENEDLAANLSAAAHLIHGSTEGRFKVTYCSGYLSSDEIESVGFNYADVLKMSKKYLPKDMRSGWQTNRDGEKYYFISNPALGLWVAQ
ncbi:MAG: lactate racemase domain-containing protein [Candidatus Azotimanducaceae bacterium]|uniref:DUF2088 domain-containing protein n=1 Tax=OM182 bacterium TaxID=2510334 RepID=A0A520S3A9_9GAMM|nr:D-mannonate epimerase [Gammaproteobacteria bacterium]RZO76960.1 MAG: DUF2088 domain-containing protein [OM182 bacterium]